MRGERPGGFRDRAGERTRACGSPNPLPGRNMRLTKTDMCCLALLFAAVLQVVALSGLASSAGAQTIPRDILDRLTPPSGSETPAPSAGTLQEGSLDPEVYVLGPGDQFRIQAIGSRSFSLTPRVDPEGWLSLGDYGSVNVGGLTLAGARGRIHDHLGRQLRDTQVEVRLMDIRRFKVHVLGEVVQPGAYPATGATRVSEIVDAAGGVRDSASVREIRILRAGHDTPILADLAAFQTAGDLSGNPYLADGDRIVVPPRSRWFSVSGAVLHDGRWDLRDGDTLHDVLGWIGLRADADPNRAMVARFHGADPEGLYDRFDTLFVSLDRVMAGGDPFPLADGDRVYVRPRPRYHESDEVSLEGAVRRPGVFPIREGTDRLSDLIAWAGGVLPDALTERVTVVRAVAPDTVGLVEMPPPGSATYALDRAELARWRLRTSPNARRMTLDLAGELDPLLMAGDRVVVPRASGFVRVTGEVVDPGFYPHREGWDLGDYLGAAGGTTKQADRSRARLLRGAEGTATQASKAPDFAGGDIIFVPEKERNDRTGWETFRDIFGIAAQVATVILVIDQVSK